MKTKFTGVLAVSLSVMMIIPTLAGCRVNKRTDKDGKIVISIGGWPADYMSEYGHMEAMRNEFMEKYPDIYVEGVHDGFNIGTFLQKAENGELPTVFNTWFSEVPRLMDSGYVADITEAMMGNGYVDSMNPSLLEFVTTDEGRIYGVPRDAYAQGLFINKNLFIQAGLVNEDGSVMIPDTYEQLAEYATIIKQNTGRAGFIIPNFSSAGGWHLMNIAWSNGVEFVEEQPDGAWKACFNTPEFRQTLEWLYDMKWNRDTVYVGEQIGQEYTYELFAAGEGAMMIADPPLEYLTQVYNMNAGDIVVAKMPRGSVDRVSQMGGNVYMFSSAATPEQIDAVFKWFEYTGISPVYTEEQINNERDKYRASYENNGIVLPQDAFDLWVSPERVEKNREIRKEFVNINPADYETYFGFEDVTIRPEVPVCCQELYNILDRAVQEVENNIDVDMDTLISELQNEWQVNHLDKLYRVEE